MERGTVKWFDIEKGFGFITLDIGGKDIFVHKSSLEMLSGVVEKGERLEFEVVEGQKGPEAKNVRSLME